MRTAVLFTPPSICLPRCASGYIEEIPKKWQRPRARRSDSYDSFSFEIEITKENQNNAKSKGGDVPLVVKHFRKRASKESDRERCYPPAR